MPRATPEWIGRTDDTAPPPRVKARIVERQDRTCGKCPRPLGRNGEAIEFDHVLALINGGENRENNLQALCLLCHAAKSREDMAIKKKNARVKKKHLGFDKPKSPLPGSRRSKWKRKIDGTVVLRD